MDQDILFYLTAVQEMTKSHKRIAEVLVDCQCEVYQGRYTGVFYSRYLIAKKAKCSVSTVRDFIRNWEGILFSHDNRWNIDSKKQEANLYHVHQVFFEVVVYLKILNMWHKFDKIIEQLKIDQSEDEYFLVKKVKKKESFCTKTNDKLSTVYAGKLPTMNSFINSFLYKGTKKAEVPFIDKEKEAKMGIVQGIPINFTTKQKLIRNCSQQVLRETVNDYLWYKKKNPIKYPDRFIIHRAKEHQIAHIRRL